MGKPLKGMHANLRTSVYKPAASGKITFLEYIIIDIFWVGLNLNQTRTLFSL